MRKTLGVGGGLPLAVNRFMARGAAVAFQGRRRFAANVATKALGGQFIAEFRMGAAGEQFAQIRDERWLMVGEPREQDLFSLLKRRVAHGLLGQRRETIECGVCGGADAPIGIAGEDDELRQ